MSDIQDIVRTFRSRGQFKGLGGELMKQACAVLIKKCSIVHFPVHSTDIVGKYKCCDQGSRVVRTRPYGEGDCHF